MMHNYYFDYYSTQARCNYKTISCHYYIYIHLGPRAVISQLALFKTF